MSQRFFGSICLTDLIEKAKQKHSSFSKADNGKIYCNVTVWLNDEEDKFGNVMSIQASSSKQMAGKEDKFYLGNMKIGKAKEISDKDLDIDDIDVPVRSNDAEAIPEQKDPKDDLPF